MVFMFNALCEPAQGDQSSPGIILHRRKVPGDFAHADTDTTVCQEFILL